MPHAGDDMAPAPSAINWNNVDLVIFDCDGVLVDSEPLSNTVLADHATRMGWAMTGAESQSIFKGMTMTQVHNHIETTLGQSLSDGWISQYYADSGALFKTDLRAIEGIEALIERLKTSQKSVCVASQGPHEKMNITLGTTGLLPHFSGNIFSAQDVSRPKPYPDLFLHAAKTMGVVPERCCVIEDSVTGVKAANAANMKVIYYDDTASSPALTAVTVSHMQDIFPN